MRTIKVMIACAFIVAFASLGFGQTSLSKHEATPTNFLDRPVGASIDMHTTTVDAFKYALANTRVPGGIVEMHNCQDQPEERDWNPAGLPLGEVLNSLVKSDPHYRMMANDEIVNLMPADGVPALLNTRISKFDMENVDISNVYAAMNALLELKEVKTAINEAHLIPPQGTMVGSWLTSAPRHKYFSVHCENVTLREALNAIVHAQGRAVWVYWERRCNGQTEYDFDFAVR